MPSPKFLGSFKIKWRRERDSDLFNTNANELANRIYIIVPRVLNTAYGDLTMPHGRAAAQCAHVGASMVECGYKDVPFMTTIILAAENSHHLKRIKDVLFENRIRPVHFQYDTINDENHDYLQALAIGPITKSEGEIFKLLNLW